MFKDSKTVPRLSNVFPVGKSGNFRFASANKSERLLGHFKEGKMKEDGIKNKSVGCLTYYNNCYILSLLAVITIIIKVVIKEGHILGI